MISGRRFQPSGRPHESMPRSNSMGSDRMALVSCLKWFFPLLLRVSRSRTQHVDVTGSAGFDIASSSESCASGRRLDVPRAGAFGELDSVGRARHARLAKMRPTGHVNAGWAKVRFAAVAPPARLTIQVLCSPRFGWH